MYTGKTIPHTDFVTLTRIKAPNRTDEGERNVDAEPNAGVATDAPLPYRNALTADYRIATGRNCDLPVRTRSEALG